MKSGITTTGRRPSRFFACLLAVSLLAVPSRAPAESEAASEYGIKAAYLFRFLPFVEWPAATFENDSAPLVIGMIGDGPITTVLQEIIKGQTARKRHIVMKRFTDIADVTKCHMLFFGIAEKAKSRQILATVAGTHVLTVGETEGFAQMGGAINFYMDGAKVRFEINPEVARANGLSISSQLLDLAKIVGTKENAK